MLGRGMGIPGSTRRSRDASAITRYEVPQGKEDLGRCLRCEIVIVQDLERWNTATDNDDEQFCTMINISQQIAYISKDESEKDTYATHAYKSYSAHNGSALDERACNFAVLIAAAIPELRTKV